MRKALFLDRDGVINKEVNYLYKIQNFEFIAGIFETCKFFQQRNYLLIVVTNQSGIARNFYSEEDFIILNDWMLHEFEKQAVKISKVYYSPFHPKYGIGKYQQDSWCRKPNPGMLIQARDEFNINFCESILVGDKESDIEAGLNAGVKLNILVRSGHKVNEGSTKANAIIDSIVDLPNCVHSFGFINYF
ncbi:MAG: HAD family hydrolase [Goleter apudmare HA4340-LM2]|jgi:D-glycero-D-manno-heptose 1,7-bisphosphate phosphatase|nr:HAD family hydrolase [Goleter apudmare HA4340-LM2]